ncbi:AbrB/MazE/SpoVT family DNA-binding domain-containing protein [Saccharolobus islandicus]|uniref:AbrB/MazE/SpoVT family DNA-binding domain-containing protein n=1 Tax=Saccharolobus islandicus TaxID=43080 RepID=UPI0012670016|nr:AbrB/MazE/SpoVT family DNA-binding domain-containing protein [Sulfolobus islandicus]
MKPRVQRGGKPGQKSFYLNIPADIVRSLNISEEDEFILNVETKDGEITLCYKRVKKQ